MEAEIPAQGKQSVKELIGQGQGVTNIDIAKTDLKGFEKVARKYGIDYAIRLIGIKAGSLISMCMMTFYVVGVYPWCVMRFMKRNHRAEKLI